MKKSDLIWAAGFFDGEGCVRIARSRKDTYRLSVSVTQTDPRPITLFTAWFPGSFRSKWPSASKRIQFEWGSNGLHAYDFLKAVLPFLVVKQEQAEVAIAWYDLPWRARRRTAGGGWKKRTEDDKTVDFAYHQRLRDMKRTSLLETHVAVARSNA